MVFTTLEASGYAKPESSLLQWPWGHVPPPTPGQACGRPPEPSGQALMPAMATDPAGAVYWPSRFTCAVFIHLFIYVCAHIYTISSIFFLMLLRLRWH